MTRFELALEAAALISINVVDSWLFNTHAQTKNRNPTSPNALSLPGCVRCVDDREDDLLLLVLRASLCCCNQAAMPKPGLEFNRTTFALIMHDTRGMHLHRELQLHQ
jgi:hypothetical protein